MTAGSGPRRKFTSTRPPPRAEDPKSFAADVGEAVRAARQARGWTQARLAEVAGLSPNYVARLERGELGPSLFVANQLCEALGIEVDSLLRPTPQLSRTTRRRVSG
jgi:UDP-N-acetylglucosamine 1-carboxyvinyltransferase